VNITDTEGGRGGRFSCHAGSNWGVFSPLSRKKKQNMEERMTNKIVIGLDGTATGDRALEFAKDLASRIEACELLVVYIIEWSPFTFQTAEENAQRHKRREEEIALANERIIEPALSNLKDAGFTATGIVRHGDVAETLNKITVDNSGSQIVVGRMSANGISKRLFGSSTQNLVMHADVPVTVVG
jgi:nucleotide-binding universal stress UspA family protein